MTTTTSITTPNTLNNASFQDETFGNNCSLNQMIDIINDKNSEDLHLRNFHTYYDHIASASSSCSFIISTDNYINNPTTNSTTLLHVPPIEELEYSYDNQQLIKSNEEPKQQEQLHMINHEILLKEPFDQSLQHQQNQNQNQNQNQLVSAAVSNAKVRRRRTPYKKKKKNQMISRMVVQVPFDEKITSRCWRKYGQKPIKGSPHPRGYYRCSFREGCLARKRVERKKSDPNFIIITYTGNHNHPPPLHLEINNTTKSDEGDNNNNNNNNKSNVCVPVSPVANNSVETKILEVKSKGIDNENVFDEVMDDAIFEGLDEIIDLSDDIMMV